MTEAVEAARRIVAKPLSTHAIVAGGFYVDAHEVARAYLTAQERIKELEGALGDFIKWADRNDWGTVPKELEARMRAAEYTPPRSAS